MSTLASVRIQRWALTLSAYDYSTYTPLTLSAYDYTYTYKPGKDISQADASRLPLSESSSTVPVPLDTLLLLDFMDSSPVTSNEVKKCTGKDPILSRVHRWPRKVEQELQPSYGTISLA